MRTRTQQIESIESTSTTMHKTGSKRVKIMKPNKPVDLIGKKEELIQLTMFDKLVDWMRQQECSSPSIDQVPMSPIESLIFYEWRPIVVDWLMEVATNYSLARKTVQLAMQYFDWYNRLGSSNASNANELVVKWYLPIDKTNVQLLAVTCLMIASKVEEIHSPTCLDFTVVNDNAYQNHQLVDLELRLVSLMRWRLIYTTPTDWLNLLLKRCCACAPHQVEHYGSVDLYVKASFMMDLCMLHSIHDCSTIQIAVASLLACVAEEQVETVSQMIQPIVRDLDMTVEIKPLVTRLKSYSVQPGDVQIYAPPAPIGTSLFNDLQIPTTLLYTRQTYSRHSSAIIKWLQTTPFHLIQKTSKRFKKVIELQGEQPGSIHQYQRYSQVGQGVFGIVYRGQHTASRRPVVLKQLKSAYSADDGLASTALRETSLLQLVQTHDNIVRLEDIVLDKNRNVFLIMESMDQDLHSYIARPPNRSIERRADCIRSYMKQLLSGLSHAHSRGVIHRDLKPQNILLSTGTDKNQSLLKIGDFGSGRFNMVPGSNGPVSPEVVTLWYRAPELLLGQRDYSSSIDLWSVGCIFAELMTGQPLFPGECDFDQLLLIFQLLGTPTSRHNQHGSELIKLPHFRDSYPAFCPKKLELVLPATYSPDAVNLLHKLLQLEPGKRITSEDALAHPYFNNNN